MTNFVDKYDENYFEHGKETGVSWYSNFHWMPDRSHREVQAFANLMSLPKDASVLDFGCAKGFFVRALCEQGYDAFGVDISKYAIENCDPLVKDRVFRLPEVGPYYYDYGFSKDVLEHVGYSDIEECLKLCSQLAWRWLFVVPLGGNGKYTIPEYELDQTHIIREPAEWWASKLSQHFMIHHQIPSLSGIKDHWTEKFPNGNLFLVCDSLKKKRYVHDLCAFYHCYKNKKATSSVLENVRNFYPNATIHLVSDHGDDFSQIAKRYRCQYFHETENIGLAANISCEKMKLWLDRFTRTCQTCLEEWLVILEDDVLVRHKIRVPFFDISGPNGWNGFFERPLGDMIFQLHPNLKNFGYGGCGGTLLRRSKMVAAIEQFHRISSIGQIAELAGTNASDVLVTSIMMLNNSQYKPFYDFIETSSHDSNGVANVVWRTSTHAVVHQCKNLSDFEV